MHKIVAVALLFSFSFSFATDLVKLKDIKELLKTEYKQEKEKADAENKKGVIAACVGIGLLVSDVLLLSKELNKRSEFMTQNIGPFPLLLYIAVPFAFGSLASIIYGVYKGYCADLHHQSAIQTKKIKEKIVNQNLVKRQNG